MSEPQPKESKTFPAALEKLEEMIGFIESQASKLPFDHKTLKRIELAAEEALVNVINYGYPDKDDGTIEISCSTGSSFNLTIKDYGINYDPVKNAQEIDTEAPLEERTYGGYGIFFILKIMDRVEYKREGDANILAMEKSV